MAGLTIAELLNPDLGVPHNTAPMALPSFAELLKSLDSGIYHQTTVMTEPSLAELNRNYTSEFNYSTAAMSEPRLAERVQDLPAELFNYILELTLRIEPGTRRVVHINRDYKPPLQLQICSRIREEAAEEYYSSMKFTFEADTKWEGDNIDCDAPCLAPFLSSIADRYQPFLRNIRLWMKGKDMRPKSWFVAPMYLEEWIVAEDIKLATSEVEEQFEDTQIAGAEIRTNIWTVEEDGGPERDWLGWTEIDDLQVEHGLPQESGD